MAWDGVEVVDTEPTLLPMCLTRSSRKGNCWDNSVAESFFHTLKGELIHHADYQTRAQARREIFEYIEVFYNRIRRHSTLNYQSPLLFERQQQTQAQLAA